MRFSHSGAFLISAGTTYLLMPSEKLGIIVLTNAPPVGTAESVSKMFMDYVELGAPAHRLDYRLRAALRRLPR